MVLKEKLQILPEDMEYWHRDGHQYVGNGTLRKGLLGLIPSSKVDGEENNGLVIYGTKVNRSKGGAPYCRVICVKCESLYDVPVLDWQGQEYIHTCLGKAMKETK